MENWFDVEFLLLKILRLQPSELDKMEFYRAEYIMEKQKEWSERENKQRQKEESEQKENMPRFDTNQLSKMPGGFKMPSMPSFNMPKF